jgi:hypothetical protein
MRKFLFKQVKLTYLLFAILFTSCIKEVVVNVPKVENVYSNNFELYEQKGFKVQGFINRVFQPFPDISIVDYNNTKVLGNFNNSRINLKLDSLPLHNALNIQFDLYINDNWNNDMWKMEFDNREVLVTGFSNNALKLQAYPDWIDIGLQPNPAGSNAFDRDLKGACRFYNIIGGTKLYKIERTIIHSDSTFIFSASDAGNFLGLNCERSWSIDNFKVNIIYNIVTK